MEPAFFSNFVVVALVSVLGQSFCIFMQRRGKTTMPVKLLFKWSSVFAFTALLGILLEHLMPDRHFAAILGIAMLLVVLFDTVWTRIAVAAFSAALPRRFIMPKEVENAWRPGKKFYDLKLKIEGLGFSKKLSLRTNFPGNDKLLELSTYFLSKDSRTLLCVHFAMSRYEFQTFLSVVGITKDGKCIITTNQSAADGLFMPSDCLRQIKAWTRDPERLLSIHRSFTARETLSEIPPPTLGGIWADFLKTEKYNIECGVLTPLNEIDANGILTSEGKYKLWVDTLLLSYLSITPKN